MVTLNITVLQGTEEKLVGSFQLKIPGIVPNSGIDLAVVTAVEGYIQGRGIPFEQLEEMTIETETLEDTRKDALDEVLGMFQEAALKVAEPVGNA